MNKKIVRNILYPIYRFISQDNIRERYKELEKNQWLTRSELKMLQWEKLIALIKYSYDNVPYYKKCFDKHNIKVDSIQSEEDVRKIPILTKDIIRKNLNELISEKINRKRLILNSTSGSTGENLWFHNTTAMHSCDAANGIRCLGWCGITMGDREAYLWGAPMDLSRSKKVSSLVKNSIMNRIFLSSYNLSLKSMNEYSKILSKFKPDLLTAYPSPLFEFSKFLLDNKIEDIRPKAIICSAETLFDYQRKVIEEAFQCQIFNRYGCREFGAIAHECEVHRGLHMIIDRLYIEIVNNGKHTQFGEVGEILITDLDNYGMPFIRYKIEDLGVMSEERCSCGRGFPLMSKIEGRIFNVVKTPNGNRIGGTFWTILARQIEGIEKFQIIQNEINKINFKIVPNEKFKFKSLNHLKQKISERSGKNFEVEFQIVDHIPLTKSGKYHFVISHVE